jgi:hypothetical protein
MTGHSLALLRAATTAPRGQATRTAHVAMNFLHTVSGSLATEAVPLYNAGEPASLGHAYDVNRLDAFERLHGPSRTDLSPREIAAQFANETLWLALRLRDSHPSFLPPLAANTRDARYLTALRTRGQTTWFVTESQLDSGVTIPFRSPYEQNVARAGLDHSDREGLSSSVKNLRHPDLAAENSSSCHVRLPRT